MPQESTTDLLRIMGWMHVSSDSAAYACAHVTAAARVRTRVCVSDKAAPGQAASVHPLLHMFSWRRA
jgi:hypothetical protein